MTGATRSFQLRAQTAQVDVGGRVVSTWAYGSRVPGPPIRANAGDRVTIAFANDLPVATSVHWHGLAIRNDMDGVPGVTMSEVPSGGTFSYDFVVPDAGTHWFHPHTGMQLDRGLYAPFIVDDPREPGGYDHEWIVVLDDWTDGVGKSPEQIMANLQQPADNSNAMGGMGMGGMDGGDVTYPLYLVNGRSAVDPDVLNAKPGQKVRLRIINAAADTIFDVALDGHNLDITHSDGYPVKPVTTGSVRIGMGERYDAIVTLQDGVFALVAKPMGKAGTAQAVLRTSPGQVPAAGVMPTELAGYPLTADMLTVAPGSALPERSPDSTSDVVLAGTMNPYQWTINGRTYDDTEPLTIGLGQAGRFAISNHSMMSHPLHFHGHTFQVGPAGGTGARKDTLLIPPMGSVDVDLVADNPGKWMIHCHNLYHAEAGMMTRLDYTA